MSPPTGRSAVRRLALSRIAAVSGVAATYTALVFTLYHQTGSTLWASFGGLATISAAFLAMPIGGMLADRYDRRAVMVLADLGYALGCVGIALAGSPTQRVLAAAVGSILGSAYIPASRAALPNLVGADDVGWANSLMARAFSLSNLAGSILGGALVGAVGSRSTFVVTAALNVLSAVVVATVRGRFREQVAPQGVTARERALGEGVRFVVRDRLLRAIVLAEVIAFSGVGFAVVADAPLATHFGVGPIGFALLMSTWGAGMLLGASLAPRVVSRFADFPAMVAGMAIMGAGLGGVWLSPWFVLVCAVTAAGGVGNGLVEVSRQTIVQLRTPDAVRGRVMGAVDALGGASFAASIAVAGPVVGVLGARLSYGVSGGCFLAGALAVTVLAGEARLVAVPNR